MTPAKARASKVANPRQRATRMTAATKISVTTSSGVPRLKSEKEYWAGWPSIGGMRTRVTRWPMEIPEV